MAIALRLSVIVAIVGVVIFFALRIWRRRNDSATGDAGADFKPTIGFTRLDGWKSLAVLLENRSDEKVWAEEIEIFLTDLIANQQASEATCQEIHKIHQTVGAHDMLPVSLVEAIYKAAGEPQRKYSCVLSSVVRYRVGEQWFDKTMQTYRLRMAGLTVVSERRERKPQKVFVPRNKSMEPRTADSQTKQIR